MNDKYVSKGERIATERKRLGYTQQQIADLCEVSRVQWGRYEREDSKFEGRVLKQFIELGANLSFILTGERSQTEQVGAFKKAHHETLSEDEMVMIKLYRDLTDEQRVTLQQTAKLFGGAV